MSKIKEYKRDDSRDYLAVLRSLNEIPFPVGKNLLVDFLVGDSRNNSVIKNKLYDLHNFGALDFLDKNKIFETIEKLIINNMIEVSGSVFNKFAKVLSISLKGKDELVNPSLNSVKVLSQKENSEISDEEIQIFKKLNDFLDGFNIDQKKAVVSTKNKILCIAGAGSGKTTVLTKRIEFLNRYHKVREKSILAITFTKKAKEQMKEKLKKLGIEAVVETFNSFCEKILLKYGGKIYGRKVRVANYQDKMFAILRALDFQNLSIENAIDRYFSEKQKQNKSFYEMQNIFVNDCFNLLEYFKDTKKDLVNNESKNGADFKMVFEIIKFLYNYMKNNGLRTYGDQVNDVINFFNLYKKFIPEFDHILVDEYQDVNAKQIELLDLLNSKNLFCVGDPRQSIFGWRGSDVNYILDFDKKYGSAEIINLKRNYRSNNHIVDFMNYSIEGMKMPNLDSNFSSEKNINLHNFSKEEEEFGFVLNELMNVNIPFEEIFVLARTNRQLNDFAEILKKKNIRFILKNDDKKNEEIKKGHVTLSTIHSIKGLEAEMVFVVGCNHSNFPCKSSEHPIVDYLKTYKYDKEEEERRLFYVAISRAKNKLFLTYTGKNHTYFINDKMKEIISHS